MKKYVFNGIALILANVVCVTGVVAKDVIIHAGVLIDGVSEVPKKQVSIVIRDDRIIGVEPGFIERAGADTIEVIV